MNKDKENEENPFIDFFNLLVKLSDEHFENTEDDLDDEILKINDAEDIKHKPEDLII
jgi:hypothetical protein